MAAWGAWALEVLGWWALLVGVWVTTLSSVATSDMAAAAGSALLCALAMPAARRAVGGRWHPSPGWLRWLLWLPAAVAADFVRVSAVALSQLRRRGSDPGEIRRLPLGPVSAGPVADARQAMATLTLSLTPGTFVFEVDEVAGAVVVHALTRGRSGLERAVSG
ncbi:MAG TPA: hypothetical protein VE990_09085 [Acidimicrobiales bacterium]|nr:hypothetical protein [Acidimicrobiales bacterium]